jgi:Na+-transporting NADH:ubiquinone oxidoreductase subunit A
VVHRTRKGLALPITGQPAQEIDTSSVSRVALVADDSIGLRPTMHVAEGDEVVRGQLVFEDKKMPGVRYTAPTSGRVVGVNRGERRAFQSLVIERASNAADEQVELSSFDGRAADQFDRDYVRAVLLESGLWTALRARPFSKVADPAVTPRSLFVTAIDTEPLAPEVDVVLRGREVDFARGVEALAQLTDGPVFVCTAEQFATPVPTGARIRHERFAGKHPVGAVGYHIHTLDPVGRTRTVWHAGYQDVIAIGRLFETGDIDLTRVVSLAGPAVVRPRLIRTEAGAALADLVGDELVSGDVRVISGSVLSGRKAMGPELGFLGRYHRQIAVLEEGRRRDLLGWALPGPNRFSALRVFVSKLSPGKRFPFTTALNGSHRAVMPVGVYEQVMPMDLEPVFLLKSLVTLDVERAEQLGCLELDEEDIALCTFVCPGKNDYGPYLREVLTMIEKEG